MPEFSPLDRAEAASLLSRMSRWQRIKRKLATPMIRRLLRRPDLFVVREELAANICAERGSRLAR